MESVNLEPEIIPVKFAYQQADLVHYHLGQGERRVLIMAGVHGWEHRGVQATHELLEQLAARLLWGEEFYEIASKIMSLEGDRLLASRYPTALVKPEALIDTLAEEKYGADEDKRGTISRK
jgi:hypothetical protein